MDQKIWRHVLFIVRSMFSLDFTDMCHRVWVSPGKSFMQQILLRMTVMEASLSWYGAASAGTNELTELHSIGTHWLVSGISITFLKFSIDSMVDQSAISSFESTITRFTTQLLWSSTTYIERALCAMTGQPFPRHESHGAYVKWLAGKHPDHVVTRMDGDPH